MHRAKGKRTLLNSNALVDPLFQVSSQHRTPLDFSTKKFPFDTDPHLLWIVCHPGKMLIDMPAPHVMLLQYPRRTNSLFVTTNHVRVIQTSLCSWKTCTAQWSFLLRQLMSLPHHSRSCFLYLPHVSHPTDLCFALPLIQSTVLLSLLISHWTSFPPFLGMSRTMGSTLFCSVLGTPRAFLKKCSLGCLVCLKKDNSHIICFWCGCKTNFCAQSFPSPCNIATGRPTSRLC